LEHLGGGGVSGKAAQRVNWEFAKKLINLTHLPVIVPVWDYEDIEKVYNFGAKAYSFGSRFMLTPWLPTRYVKKYLKEVKENG